jgi:hypothetical protein
MGPVTNEVKNGMFSFLMYKFVFFFWILEVQADCVGQADHNHIHQI